MVSARALERLVRGLEGTWKAWGGVWKGPGGLKLGLDGPETGGSGVWKGSGEPWRGWSGSGKGQGFQGARASLGARCIEQANNDDGETGHAGRCTGRCAVESADPDP